MQKKSSSYLKQTAAVFQLKSGGKNLTTEDYATNLCSYFDSAKSCSTLTMGDLNNVLTGLKGGYYSNYVLSKHVFYSFWNTCNLRKSNISISILSANNKSQHFRCKQSSHSSTYRKK